MTSPSPTPALRRGWTTGACAAAAAKSAFAALISGEFLDPIEIPLPGGTRPSFALALQEHHPESAMAGIIKDAGDDPDVTHQAMICVSISKASPGSGLHFHAGRGVGMVTRPGLPLPVGEPAINPAPRAMIRAALEEVATQYRVPLDLTVTISVPGGEILAEKTLNPRLGILGGISILGTTGIVIPYSCSAWIHSIHRGIDVARAAGITHIAGATGNQSERAVQSRYHLPDIALIDMGDFVGGMLKYLRKHPVARVSIAGGFGKMSKLAQGHLDLHSGRSQVDLTFLAEVAEGLKMNEAQISEMQHSNSALHALQIAGESGPLLAQKLATLAWRHAARLLERESILLEIIIFDREGSLLGSYDSLTNLADL